MTPRPNSQSFKNIAKGIRQYSAPAEGAIPASKQRFIPTDAHIPKDYLFGTAYAGVKPSNKSNHDVAVVHSTAACSAASVFTQNRFQAAPVTVSRDILDRRKGRGIKGIVINSGCANAVTGHGGLEDAKSMSSELDHALRQQEGASMSSSSSELSSLVMSTGVIGQRLPMPKITPAIAAATAATGSTYDAFHRVARAICTTDTFPKLASRTFTLPSFPGSTFAICGTAKGAGMIHPNMATLLGLLCTDAPVAPNVLSSVLKSAVDKSFNCISIDGDTSTNDTVSLLANGAGARASPLYKSAPPEITDADSGDAQALSEAVTDIAGQLARLVVRDGEGATKFVTIRVAGAPDHYSGRQIASSVARSPLVKTALYGKDANWGRILCAVGYTDGLAEGIIDPSKVSVSFVREADGEELRLLVDGEPVAGGVDEEKAGRMLQDEELQILIRLGEGNGGEEVRFWTCDLSHEYVTINGDYRT
ncbi:MAG: hypothetical protein Q9162_007710 [Coniocarpon cinnabarinum]